MTRKLKVFLCHASEDKPAVYELYNRLVAESWIDPWLDKENLLPGQDWNLEINKATREADVIIICMSKVSVEKEGYLNKEIRRVLDISNEKLEGAIYIIPLRLDDCSPSFERLKQIHYADYFVPNAHEHLLKSLRVRAADLKIEIGGKATKRTSMAKSSPKSKPHKEDDEPIIRYALPWIPSDTSNVDLDLYKFIQIPPTEEVPYSFYIGKYPVTNIQYERFLNSPDFSDKLLWVNFPKYNENCILVGKWGSEGWDWFQENAKVNKRILPGDWVNKNFGISNPENPIVGVSWYEANAYCNWLMRHWSEVAESKANTGLRPRLIRMPLENEWIIAAGGEKPENRFPWDATGKVTDDIKEIVKRANIEESNIEHTTPVNAYLRGASPFGVMDMAGNIWEKQMNYQAMKKGFLGLRGGSWRNNWEQASVAVRSYHDSPVERSDYVGFRVAAFSP